MSNIGPAVEGQRVVLCRQHMRAQIFRSSGGIRGGVLKYQTYKKDKGVKAG